jgi:hypothetical protein
LKDPDLYAEKIAWKKEHRAKKRIESEKEREGELREIEEARQMKAMGGYKGLVDKEEDMKSNRIELDDTMEERDVVEQFEEDFM